MRATVEYHGIDTDYPLIKVIIADGSDNKDVIIKVSDEGGGIPRSNTKRIWSYVSIWYICFIFVRCGCSDLLSDISSFPFLCTKLISYSQLPTPKSKRVW